jgi:SAM-dependent methyltransferase
VPVLVDETHEMNLLGMFHQLPQSMSLLAEALPASFRSGIGHDYDTLGPEGAHGVERGFEPWMRNHLVADLLPRLDGVVDRLSAGVAAADVGCGSGAGVLRMARAFPASRFAGYDISQFALDRAAEHLAAAGLTNAEFHDPRSEPLPDDGSFSFVTTFDCLHDMTDPDGVARAIRASLADDGTWLVADIKAYDSFAENVERNPMAALMYGTSVLSCMSSALSEPDGAGLGTLGMSENRARQMATEAGFSRFRTIDVDSPINAFYEIRP